MKFTKNRLLSLLLVLAMMLALVPSVFADGETPTTTPITGLSLPATATVEVGAEQTLTLTKTPENGTGTIEWTSSDPAKATVSTVDGVTKVKGLAVTGDTGVKITAKVKDSNPEIKAECTVKVTQATISLSQDQRTLTLKVGTQVPKDYVQNRLASAFTDALTSANSPYANIVELGDWADSSDNASSSTYDSESKKDSGTWKMTAKVKLKTGMDANYTLATNAVDVTATVTFVKSPEFTFAYQINSQSVAYNKLTVSCAKSATAQGPVLKATVTPKDSSVTGYTKRWVRVVRTGSSETTTTVGTANSDTFTVPVTEVGTFTYRMEVEVTKNGVTFTTLSDEFTVTVKDPYQVVLSKSYSSTSNVVGQYVYYTATLKAYNSTNDSYDITVQNSAFNYVSFISNDVTKAKIISGATMQTNSSYITLDLYSAGTAKLNATLYPTPNSTSNSMTVPVVGDITISAAEVSPISMNPTTSTYALIDTTTLVNAIYSATNSSSLSKTITTSSIVFNGNGYGTFSTTGSSGSSSYTFTNTSYASSFYFVPSSSYTGFTSPNMYITYTAYSSDGTIATGKIYFTSASSITYNATASTPVYFKASDFSDYFKTALGGTYNSSYYTLSEVTFGTPRVSNSSVTSGTLYYNNGYISTTRVPAANLGYVSYTPSSSTYTYTVSIPFTAYGTYYYGSTATKTVSGTVTIKVNDGHVITMVGTDFKSASIWSDITSKHPGVSYVSFSQPQSTVGKLYYGYTSIASKGSLVSYTDRFNNSNYNYSYANTIKSIDGIYFVPAADCLDTVTLTYTAYTSATATTGVSDTITFTITKKTASSIFNDVTASNTGKWSADAIDFLARNSIVEGGSYGTFNPNGNMTRGDFVLMLYRMAGKPSVSGISNPFTDVKSTNYYYNAILWAYRNDIVTGVDAKTFAPKKNITREQIAATLYRMAGSPSASGYLTGYYDYAKIHSYATNAMRWAISNGVITGSNGYLTPTNNATRAQVAAMLHRYLTK